MNFPKNKIIYLGIGKEISQKVSSKKDLSYQRERRLVTFTYEII